MDKYTLLTIFALIWAVVCLCGCSSPEIITREVPIEVVKTERQTDTIMVERWHTIETKGDSVYLHDSIIRWRVREFHTADTIPVVHYLTDTVYIESEAVASPLLKFYKGFACVGLAAVVGLIIAIITRFRR